MTLRATIMKLTKIEMAYKITAEDKSVLPVKPIMQMIFAKQHTA